MIDDGLIPLVAQRFKALADPGRLAILASLQSGEKIVSGTYQAIRELKDGALVKVATPTPAAGAAKPASENK